MRSGAAEPPGLVESFYLTGSTDAQCSGWRSGERLRPGLGWWRSAGHSTAASRRPNARTAARCSPSRLRPDRAAGPRPDGCLEGPARYGTGAARDRFLRRRDPLRSLHADLLEVVNRDMR